MSFDVARAIFNQIDANKDGSIDQSELNQWMSGAGGGFSSGSSYESSQSSGGYGAGAGSAGGAYESSSSYG
ncbi:unnamed protein product, partial [Rotaria magnacalcarata]